MLNVYQKITPHLISRVLFIAILLVSTTKSFGAILTVTTNIDTDDSICNSQCSLREAIEVASSGDTIIFAPSLRGSTIQLTKFLLIDKRITIDGPNKRRITLKGDNTFRVLEINNQTGGIVTIDGLIIRDGNAGEDEGGGIYITSGDTLLISDSVITNSKAKRGGGIYIFGGRLYASGTSITNNVATGDATAGGIEASYASIRVYNSTISSNSATGLIDTVGGIRSFPSDFVLSNTTVAYNASSGGTNLSVGGIISLNPRPGASFSFYNSIIAKNFGGQRPDLYGVFTTCFSNLIGVSDNTTGINNGVNGNIVGTLNNPIEPHLEILTDSLTGMPHHPLLPASPAVNTGNNAFAIDYSGGRPLITDQRGSQRIFNSNVDIGSYEYGSTPAVTSTTVVGQVTTATGRGVFGALVLLRNSSGEVKTAVTNPFGYFSFAEISGGAVYTIDCNHKRYTFASETFTAEEKVEYVNFTNMLTIAEN